MDKYDAEAIRILDLLEVTDSQYLEVKTPPGLKRTCLFDTVMHHSFSRDNFVQATRVKGGLRVYGSRGFDNKLCRNIYWWLDKLRGCDVYIPDGWEDTPEFKHMVSLPDRRYHIDLDEKTIRLKHHREK